MFCSHLILYGVIVSETFSFLQIPKTFIHLKENALPSDCLRLQTDVIIPLDSDFLLSLSPISF